MAETTSETFYPTTILQYNDCGGDSPEQSIEVVPRYLSYFLAVYLMMVGTIGGIGNLIVIIVFTKTKSLRSPGNMLIINLAISDLTMVITQFPAMFLTTVAGEWLYGEAGCQIYAFLGSTFGIMSIATMSAISIDRYYVICKPMKATHTVTKRRAMYIILSIWVYSLTWSVLPLFGFGRYTREGYGLSCTFDYKDQSMINMIFVGTIFVTDFFLPLFLIICCYTKIVLTVRKHKKVMKRFTHNKTQEENTKSEFKIAKIGMVMTTLFCVSWLPYASVAFTGQFIDPSIPTPLIQTIPVVLAKSSAVLNPIIYAMSFDKFKIAFTDKFIRLCCSRYEKEKSFFYDSRSQTLRRTYSPSAEVERQYIPLENFGAEAML